MLSVVSFVLGSPPFFSCWLHPLCSPPCLLFPPPLFYTPPPPPSPCVSAPGGGLKIPVLSPWHAYKCAAIAQTHNHTAGCRSGFPGREQEREWKGWWEGGTTCREAGGGTEKGCCEVIFHHRVHFSLQTSPSLHIAPFLFIHPRLLLPFASPDPALSLFIFPFPPFFTPSHLNSLHPFHVCIPISLSA